MAHGGSAVARRDGKAYFIDGALPGELVSGTIEVDKPAWGKVQIASVIEAAPERTEPLCGHFGTCGGCQWQHGEYTAQLEWKQAIVSGQMKHLGRHPNPPVRPTVATGSPFQYRNRMDFRVHNGRTALHQRRSRNLIPLSECQILHPNLAALLVDLGDLSGVKGLTMRTATTTGDVLIIIEGAVPRQASSWGCAVAVVEDDTLRAVHGDAVLEETVAGVPFRISGKAFFQNNTAGAERLVRLVTEAAGVRPEDTLLDAYAGGGLFAATVGRDAGRVVAIERDKTAAQDLQANLNRAGIDDYRILRSSMDEAIEGIDEYWDVVVADPPRKGLGIDGVDAVTAAEPRTLVYVSCDPASLARDTAILDELGYDLDWVTPVDMFPQTFHIECVAKFDRFR
ncbi:MAG: class I SAM-dependent RNA methyltransferase [bacterium]|nr:class I SAM-dependent RNA methyltransferase [bacterium]